MNKSVISEPPLPIDLNMDFGDKSKVMEVLNRAYAGTVVDKHVAASALREFQGRTHLSCYFLKTLSRMR